MQRPQEAFHPPPPEARLAVSTAHVFGARTRSVPTAPAPGQLHHFDRFMVSGAAAGLQHARRCSVGHCSPVQGQGASQPVRLLDHARSAKDARTPPVDSRPPTWRQTSAAIPRTQAQGRGWPAGASRLIASMTLPRVNNCRNVSAQGGVIQANGCTEYSEPFSGDGDDFDRHRHAADKLRPERSARSVQWWRRTALFAVRP